MNLIELESSLRQLRLGGMAAVLETRLRQAQVEAMPPIDLVSVLVSDELTRRGDRVWPENSIYLKQREIIPGVVDNEMVRCQSAWTRSVSC